MKQFEIQWFTELFQFSEWGNQRAYVIFFLVMKLVLWTSKSFRCSSPGPQDFNDMYPSALYLAPSAITAVAPVLPLTIHTWSCQKDLALDVPHDCRDLSQDNFLALSHNSIFWFKCQLFSKAFFFILAQ